MNAFGIAKTRVKSATRNPSPRVNMINARISGNATSTRISPMTVPFVFDVRTLKVALRLLAIVFAVERCASLRHKRSNVNRDARK